MPVKVVYNACFGGFGLSKKAMERLRELGVPGIDHEMEIHDECFKDYPSMGGSYRSDQLPRHDARLVQVVEELGEDACGNLSDLRVVELVGRSYIIDDYDGNESVVEPADMNWVIVEE